MWKPMRYAEEYYGLNKITLRRHAIKGFIKAKRTQEGRWLFWIGDQEQKTGVICYCRVSSAKQKNDLARQVVFMRKQFPEAEIIQDIGSGLNFKRKGLVTVLERISRGDKLTIVVAHRDRLARFGFELIEWLVKKHGGEIVVLDKNIHSPQTEIVADLLSIITVFSCRVNGLRRYHSEMQKDKILSESGAEEDV